jgi:hypothetical protein
MSELWIPILAISSVAIIVLAALLLAARNKSQLHNTLQKHLENSGELSPALLQQLGAYGQNYKSDLRRGLIFTALGIACVVAGAVSGNIASGAMFGVFPLFVGGAYCIIAFINKDE